jgi:FMN reductase
VPSIIAFAGSPSITSRTVALTEHLAERLRARGHDVRVVPVRSLPAAALLGADTAEPAIRDVLAGLARADGVVVASAVYKASYTGVLKVLLDLLPPDAMAGKVVLPLLTVGAPIHTLALDYALRPVLFALGAPSVLPGSVVLDKDIERVPDGVILAPEAQRQLDAAVATFDAAVSG